jgi:hypothetical protein
MRQQALFRTSWLNIVFQAVFLALLYVVKTFASLKVGGAWRTAVTWFSVLLPCGAWVWFFYPLITTLQVATRLNPLINY